MSQNYFPAMYYIFYIFEVPESSAVSFLIGTVAASDDDAGVDGDIQFHIQGTMYTMYDNLTLTVTT